MKVSDALKHIKRAVDTAIAAPMSQADALAVLEEIHDDIGIQIDALKDDLAGDDDEEL